MVSYVTRQSRCRGDARESLFLLRRKEWPGSMCVEVYPRRRRYTVLRESTRVTNSPSLVRVTCSDTFDYTVLIVSVLITVCFYFGLFLQVLVYSTSTRKFFGKS